MTVVFELISIACDQGKVIKMPRSVVGLNIGSRFIKAVELRQGRGGAIEVSALGIAPTPEAALAAGEILQPDALVDALKELLREAGIRSKDTVVTIAGQAAVVVRVTEVPKMPYKELVSTMALEIEREVPFAPDSIRKDFVPLRDMDEVSEGETVPVLYAAVRNDVLETYIDVLLKAGLNPIAVEVEPLASVRALIDLPQSMQEGSEFGQNDLVVIVNIGAESSDVIVTHGGIIAFPRILPIGSDEFTVAISDALGLDRTEAERLKQEEGTAWIEELMTMPRGYTSTAGESETTPIDELGMSELGMDEIETDGGTPTDDDDFTLELDEEPKEEGKKKGSEYADEFTLELPLEQQAEPEQPTASGEEETEELTLPLDFAFEVEMEQGGQEMEPEGMGIEEIGIEEVGLEETEEAQPAEDEFDYNFGVEELAEEAEQVGVPSEFTLEGETISLEQTKAEETKVEEFQLEVEPTAVSQPQKSAEGEEMETESIIQPPEGAKTTVSDVDVFEGATPTPVVTARYIFDAIESRLHDLATEIVRSVEYYTGKVPNAEVRLIYIIGGGARLNGLDKFLEYQLGVPVKVGNPFRYLKLDPVVARYGRAYIDDIAPYMVIALGAALRELL
jgi:type IV pilus assembly protein PilM